MEIPHPFREVENAWRTELHHGSYLLITNREGDRAPKEGDEITRVSEFDKYGRLTTTDQWIPLENLQHWVLLTKRPFRYPLHPGSVCN